MAGVPVGVHWSVLVIGVLIGMSLGGVIMPEAFPGQPTALYVLMATLTVVLFLGSLLAHELAHAVVAQRRGLPVRSITLWLFGGMAELEGEARTPRHELETAAAGPLTSLAFAVASFLVAVALPGPELLVVGLTWLAYMNVLLAVFNMLPGAPLDGGRVLHAVVWWKTKSRARADQIASTSGQVLGVALIVAGVGQIFFFGSSGGFWTMIIGWFLAGAARSERVASAAREGLGGVLVRHVMTSPPEVAPSWATVEDFVATTALHSRQAVFVVVDFEGRPVGYVSLDWMAALPYGARATTRVSTLARPVPPENVVAPDEEASVLFTKRALPGQVIALVSDEGRAVGIVTTADLTRAMRQAMLRQPV
ncbi:site-2 protease family protein [Thermopolyspora sp. NPDC052614]|uniref:site-2 protease family protein n=1 Tax=Thermopolyspora sp. NPDC052614 TaxID=3155682 RepID=UPI0034287240